MRVLALSLAPPQTLRACRPLLQTISPLCSIYQISYMLLLVRQSLIVASMSVRREAPSLLGPRVFPLRNGIQH